MGEGKHHAKAATEEDNTIRRLHRWTQTASRKAAKEARGVLECWSAGAMETAARPRNPSTCSNTPSLQCSIASLLLRLCAFACDQKTSAEICAICGLYSSAAFPLRLCVLCAMHSWLFVSLPRAGMLTIVLRIARPSDSISLYPLGQNDPTI